MITLMTNADLAPHAYLYILPFNNDNQGVTTCKITMYI